MKLLSKLFLLASATGFVACDRYPNNQSTHAMGSPDGSIIYYVDLDAVRVRAEKDGGEYLLDYRQKTFTSIFYDRGQVDPPVTVTLPFNQVSDPASRAAIDTLLTYCEKTRFPEGKQKYLDEQAEYKKNLEAHSFPALLDTLKKKLNSF